jgi:hypothetical protein
MAIPGEDDWSTVPDYGGRLVWRRGLFGGFKARVSGRAWSVRMNNFPDEPAYTLLIDGRKVIDFNDWPSDWVKRR